jgi:hypothetical protein
MYSFMVWLLSFALFLMSSWTFCVTVMHLYPLRGKTTNLLSVLYRTNEYIISGFPHIVKPYINVRSLISLRGEQNAEKRL